MAFSPIIPCDRQAPGGRQAGVASFNARHTQAGGSGVGRQFLVCGGTHEINIFESEIFGV